MLIYCNQLEIENENSFESVLRSIAGWLKMVTKRHFLLEDLISGEEFEVNRMWVRTYKADASETKLYSVLFSNPDSTVYGRQWITEIGIRVVEGKPTFFTLLLETSDISTRVKDVPITTKPKVINFLRKNCTLSASTRGMRIKNLSGDEDDLKAFLYEIEDETRKIPLVLLSHRFDGDPYTNPKTLQDHLLGLAQVVICSAESDSWLMEKILTKRFSAWGGAINIIYPLLGRDICRNQLFMAKDLDEFISKSVNINLELLSHITHFSNAFRKRHHFSPYDVRAKRIADQRRHLKQLFENKSEKQNYEELLEEAFTQIDEHEVVLEKTKEELTKRVDEEQYRVIALEDELFSQKKEVRRMKFLLSNQPLSGGVSVSRQRM